MARKKTGKTPDVDVQYKTLEELTDGEFILGADRLSVPFYLDYLSAPAESRTSINGYVSDTQTGILAKNAQTRLTTTKKLVEVPIQEEKVPQKTKKYISKRVGCLILVVLLSLILLLVAVLGFVAPSLAGYLGVFKDGETTVTALDPIFGLVDSLAKTSLTENYPYYASVDNEYEAIPVYAVSCAALLFIICMLVVFIKSLVALFEGAKEGYFKKRKFGYTSVVACLCAVIVFIGGLYMTGGDIMGVTSFINPLKEGTTALFGVYAMILLSVLIAIFSAGVYGKEKENA